MDQPKLGRPPVLDDQKRGHILGVLSVGGSMALAAAAVGCCVRTIYNTGRRDPKFMEQIQQARAGCEIKLLKCVDDAASDPRYWRAAAWKLERIRPERYRAPKPNTFTQDLMQGFVEQLLTLLQQELAPHRPNSNSNNSDATNTCSNNTDANNTDANNSNSNSNANSNANANANNSDATNTCSNNNSNSAAAIATDAKAEAFFRISDRIDNFHRIMATETDGAFEHALDYFFHPSPTDAA